MTQESNMEIKNEKFLATNVPFASHQKSYSDLTCDMLCESQLMTCHHKSKAK